MKKQKLDGITIGKQMRKTIKKIHRKQSRYFLKTKAEEYGIKMGFFESKKSIIKRIDNLIMGVPGYYSPEIQIWPRPPKEPEPTKIRLLKDRYMRP